MTYSVLGARELPQLGLLEPHQLVSWLRQGFERAGSQNPADMIDAFPPLVLISDQSVTTQIGTAFREAEHAHQPVTERMRTAMETYLSGPEAVQTETLSMLAHFWQFLGAIGVQPSVHDVAMKFLEGLGSRVWNTEEEGEDLERVLGAIVDTCASARPVTGSLGRVFKELQKQNFWREWFLPLAISHEFDLASAQARRIEEAWEGQQVPEEYRGPTAEQIIATIEQLYPAQLGLVANTGSPAGRAMLKSLARRLGREVPGDIDGLREMERELADPTLADVSSMIKAYHHMPAAADPPVVSSEREEE